MEVQQIKRKLYYKLQNGYSGVLIGIIVCLTLVFGVAAFLVVNGFLASQTKTDVTVRLNWLHQAQYAGMYVALDKGFYEKEGLKVKFLEYEEGLDQNKEVAEGKVEFAISTPIEMLDAVDKGSKIEAIAVVHQISPYAFASLKPENIQSPQDFSGKVLGAMGGSREAYTKYNFLLSKHSAKATIKELGFEKNEVEHLLGGASDVVDLYRTDQPYLFQMEGLEYDLILPENYGIRTYGDIIIASSDFLSQNPDIAKSFLSATFRGWEYAFEHEKEAVEIVTKYQNELYADRKRQEFILQQSKPLILQTSQELGSMSFTIWNQTVKAVDGAELLENELNAVDLYTNEFLN